MTTLVACLSTESGAAAYLAGLCRAEDWEGICIITTEEAKKELDLDSSLLQKTTFVMLSRQKSVSELAKDIKDGLEGRIPGFDVALNLISGTGKAHMAIISAILSLGLAIRLVQFSDGQISEI